jgi:hypothetical protein
MHTVKSMAIRMTLYYISDEFILFNGLSLLKKSLQNGFLSVICKNVKIAKTYFDFFLIFDEKIESGARYMAHVTSDLIKFEFNF